MRALVFADRLGAELAPLTDTRSVPLLPVAGKEILVYTIEDLVRAGVRDLVVVASAHGEQTGASSLGDGQRWGASIRYVLSRGEEPPSAFWPRLNLAGSDALLVLRGDVLRSACVQEFLLRAQNEPGHSAFCAVGDDPRGALLLLRPGCPRPGELLDTVRWDEPAVPPAGSGGVADGVLSLIQDLPAFHRANLDLLAGRFPGLAAPGRTIALGLTADRRARVSPRSLKQGTAYVGAESRLHPEAELLGEVVVGADVVVDRAATVRDSVILPRTYVGELVEVSNAIVAGNHLIRVDTGAVLKVSDAFLLGSLGADQDRARVSAWDRLVGLALLVLSLPLWLVAALASGGGMGSRELLGNRSSVPRGGSGSRAFVARHWKTPVPVLRNLPALLAVVRGDLRLVGVSPLTPEQSADRTEDWQMVRDQAPVGLLGPTQLDLPASAPLEERLLSDAFYAREQSWIKDIGYLLGGLKALFSATAWHRAG
jgi:NDP-sugar pyrophosphorylase family protein